MDIKETIKPIEHKHGLLAKDKIQVKKNDFQCQLLIKWHFFLMLTALEPRLENRQECISRQEINPMGPGIS